jgi:hypothetical protein
MVNKEVFRTLSETEIKDYLANIVWIKYLSYEV